MKKWIARIENGEPIVNEVQDEEAAKKMMMALLDDNRQNGEEPTLAESDCSDVPQALMHNAAESGLSPEHCSFDFEPLGNSPSLPPPIRITFCVKAIVEQLKMTDQINREIVAISLSCLRKDGMTRKEIKKAVNKHLALQQRKAFTKVLDELWTVSTVFRKEREAVNKAKEFFDGVESKPVSKNDAHKMVVDHMSRGTQELLEDKCVLATVTLRKGDRSFIAPLYFTNYDEKNAILHVLKRLAMVIQPDAIITVSAVWQSPDVSIGDNGWDNRMPSTDPDKREALMVIVETPTGLWAAEQMFSRKNDGEMVLEELSGPQQVETANGRFVFMERGSTVTAH